MKINIFQIACFSPPYEGNFIPSLRLLEEKLLLLGQSTSYLFPKEAKQFQWISSIQNRGRPVYLYQDNLIERIMLIHTIIKKEKVGIIHLHFGDNKTHFCIQIIKFLHPIVKIVLHHHNHFRNPKSRIKAIFKNYIYKADMHIGVSQSVTEKLPAGLKTNNKITIKNAIYFPRLDEYQIVTHKDLNVRENSHLLLIFGGHYLTKGVDLAIEALAPIAEQENIILIIVCSVRKDVAVQLIECQFGPMPRWIRLMDARSDIASYYKAVDIFLSPSREEGFCYAVVEAAYCKNQIIASNVPGQNSLKIPHTREFDIGDIELFRKHILQCIHMQADELKNIQLEQKTYVQEVFRIDNWVSEVITAYNNLGLINQKNGLSFDHS